MNHGIYINIIEKTKYKKIYKKYKAESQYTRKHSNKYKYGDKYNNPYTTFIESIKNGSTYSERIDSRIEIDKYDSIKMDETSGKDNTIHILQRKDLKDILKQYQNLIVEDINKIDENYEKLSKDIAEKLDTSLEYTIKLASPEWDMLQALFDFVIGYVAFTKEYFEKLIKDDKLISETDNYILQYFNIVRIYDNFEDQHHVLVITTTSDGKE